MWLNPSITATAVGGLFFPLTRLLGMSPESQLSPALLKKVVHAGACSTSFRQAADDLRVLAEVEVSAQRVRRATERVGSERVAASEAAADSFAQLPLPAQQQRPDGVAAPEMACVQADGGRIQIRPRAADASSTTESGPWWRETKVGCLLSMTSDTHEQDPTPTLPAVFLQAGRMAEMVRGIKGFSGEACGEELAEAAAESVHQAPLVVAHTVLATRENVEVFGARLAAAAHAQGFAAAKRKAFVADGSETNWGIHRRHFSHYAPILDWIHAVCYVYAAAMAGVNAREGWEAYRAWAQWLWSGAIDRLLEQLQVRQDLLGTPTAEDAPTAPRQRIADALRYLRNQRSRMNYPEYRRQGLPITSSHVESTIKRINRRMKGTEKFWDQGAEPLLHLAADHLSPSDALDHFWSHRPTQLNPQRHYATAS